jgi:hypothetical protein
LILVCIGAIKKLPVSMLVAIAQQTKIAQRSMLRFMLSVDAPIQTPEKGVTCSRPTQSIRSSYLL